MALHPSKSDRAYKKGWTDRGIKGSLLCFYPTALFFIRVASSVMSTCYEQLMANNSIKIIFHPFNHIFSDIYNVPAWLKALSDPRTHHRRQEYTDETHCLSFCSLWGGFRYPLWILSGILYKKVQSLKYFTKNGQILRSLQKTVLDLPAGTSWPWFKTPGYRYFLHCSTSTLFYTSQEMPLKNISWMW